MSDAMQFSNRQLSDEAKKLEAVGQFVQAADLYKQSYDLYPGGFVTSHYIRCLRKLGKSTAAVKFGRQLVRQLREDSFVHKELSWAMYDVYLKKTENMEGNEFDDVEHEQQGNSDFRKMQEVANYILSRLSANEDILRTRTIFAICNEAKQRGNWQTMYDFAIQLDPERLSTEQREWKGRKLPSDYQSWLFKMVRSLLELERYKECLVFASKGIEKYPSEKLFYWWQACAKKALGQVIEALQELEQIDARFPKEWYIQRDIANGYIELKEYDVAWIWFCKAASCPGDPRGRFKMFESMSMLLEQLDRFKEAYDHLLLAVMVADQERWDRPVEALRGKLIQFRRRHEEQVVLPTDSSSKDWLSLNSRCRTFWQKTIQTSRLTYKGQIIKINEERHSGFIRRSNSENAKDIYFRFRDVVKKVNPVVGMEVEFEVEKSFDPAKNQESLAAVNIRQIKSSV
jgi:tetratricopeptide (TPR) repeat protein